MRGTAIGILVFFLAGCMAAEDAKVDEVPVDLSAYADCTWISDGRPGACWDPRDPDHELDLPAASSYGDDWRCVHWSTVDDGPDWRLLRAPASGEALTPSLDVVLGLWFDVSPHPGPVQGWFRLHSDEDAPLYHFTSRAPNGFVAFPEPVRDPEILYEAVIIPSDVIVAEAPLGDPYETMADPSAWTDARTTAYQEGIRLELEGLRHNAVRASGPYEGGRFYLTHVTGDAPDLMFFPSVPLGFRDIEDPREVQGSGHWGMTWGRPYTTRESGPGWRLDIDVPMIPWIYGHQQDVRDPMLPAICGCIEEPDPVDRTLCQVREGLPPVVRGPDSMAMTVGP